MNGEVNARFRRRVQHPGGGLSKTRQGDALKSDINSIIERYVVHGVVDGAPGQARYGDFSNAVDFKTAMDRVRSAEEDFMELPAHIRKYVNNDPGEFLDLVMDADRHQELVDLGLAEAHDPSLPEPPPAQPDPPPAPADPE